MDEDKVKEIMEIWLKEKYPNARVERPTVFGGIDLKVQIDAQNNNKSLLAMIFFNRTQNLPYK